MMGAFGAHRCPLMWKSWTWDSDFLLPKLGTYYYYPVTTRRQ